MTVHTTEPSGIILNKDTFQTIDNKAVLMVERKKEALNITASTDSLSKSLEIESKNSIAYWSNIFFNYGIGMIVDRQHPKRYSYPQKIYINSADKVNRYSLSADTVNRYFLYEKLYNKGELYFHLSIPHINSFYLKPENEGAKVNTGFWGLSLGLGYYHAENQFINLSIAGVTDFFVPVPASPNIDDEYEQMSSTFISLSNNHEINQFRLGYGLSYARNTWRFEANNSARESIRKSHHSFGLVFPTYYQIKERFHIGLSYRPTFIIPSRGGRFEYEHLISIDLMWKMPLLRGQRATQTKANQPHP